MRVGGWAGGRLPGSGAACVGGWLQLALQVVFPTAPCPLPHRCRLQAESVARMPDAIASCIAKSLALFLLPAGRERGADAQRQQRVRGGDRGALRQGGARELLGGAWAARRCLRGAPVHGRWRQGFRNPTLLAAVLPALRAASLRPPRRAPPARAGAARQGPRAQLPAGGGGAPPRLWALLRPAPGGASAAPPVRLAHRWAAAAIHLLLVCWTGGAACVHLGRSDRGLR